MSVYRGLTNAYNCNAKYDDVNAVMENVALIAYWVIVTLLGSGLATQASTSVFGQCGIDS